MIHIKVTQAFQKEFKKLNKKSHTLVSSLYQLKEELLVNPELGIPLGGNFFKIRIKSDYSGKSGGYRIITYYKQEDTLTLASIYQKSHQQSISLSELQEIIQNDI